MVFPTVSKKFRPSDDLRLANCSKLSGLLRLGEIGIATNNIDR